MGRGKRADRPTLEPVSGPSPAERLLAPVGADDDYLIHADLARFHAEKAQYVNGLKGVLAEHPGSVPAKLIVDGAKFLLGVSVAPSAELDARLTAFLAGPQAPIASLDEARQERAVELRAERAAAEPLQVDADESQAQVPVPSPEPEVARAADANARYPQLGGMWSSIVVGELDAEKLAVAEVLVDRYWRSRRAGGDEGARWVRLEDVWQALYDHRRDHKTGDVYVEDGGGWLRLERDQLEKVELAAEVVARLETRRAVVSGAEALQPPRGSAPPSPEHLRRKVIKALRECQLPIVSSTDPTNPGYALTTSREEMEREQQPERKRIETLSTRLDSQLEAVARLEHYEATGELLHVDVVEDDSRGPNYYKGQRQRAGAERRSRAKARQSSGLSWDDAIGAS